MINKTGQCLIFPLARILKSLVLVFKEILKLVSIACVYPLGRDFTVACERAGPEKTKDQASDPS